MRCRSARWVSALIAAALVAPTVARADAKEDVDAAIQKLNELKSYTWTVEYHGWSTPKATVKVDNAGLSSVATTFDHKPLAIVIQGFKAAIQTSGGWKTTDELADDPTSIRLATTPNPYLMPVPELQRQAEEATAFAPAADGTLAGEMPAKKAAAAFVPPPRGATKVTDAKGTVTVTLDHGVIAKIVTRLTATTDGPDRTIERTITTTISDVDHTTPDVPAEAKAKLGK